MTKESGGIVKDAKEDNMQYDTAGNPMVFYDMCACCDLDTGGNHQHWCPCYQPPIQKESYAEFQKRGRWKDNLER